MPRNSNSKRLILKLCYHHVNQFHHPFRSDVVDDYVCCVSAFLVVVIEHEIFTEQALQQFRKFHIEDFCEFGDSVQPDFCTSQLPIAVCTLADALKNLESQGEISLRSQIVILEDASSRKGKHSKYSSFAFTEQGVAMLSSVLKSKKAVLVNISIMRAFVLFRQFALTYNELAQKMAELEMKYDGKFEDFQAIIDLLLEEKVKQANWENRQMIGFRK